MPIPLSGTASHYFKEILICKQMTRIKTWAAFVALGALMLTSCDDTTDSIGTSLIDDIDRLTVKADTFEVTTRTIMADSVIARNITGYLGRVKDPETGNYITGDFMVQLHTLSNYQIANIDSILSRDEAGEIIADSCEILLVYNNFYGDSLAQMKLTAYELDHPLEEGSIIYSNFDPSRHGYIRQDGIKQERTYTLADQTRNSSSTNTAISIRLDAPYTDKAGKRYNNFGTYLLRKFYESPEAFRNPYRFLHEVNPGFMFKVTNGIGSMAYVTNAQLNIFFRMQENGKEAAQSTSLASTEEVLQTTTFSNDNNLLSQLAAQTNCTYLKSPSGLFTEVTLPVDEILRGHENDTLNTAKVVFPRINSTISSDYLLNAPSTVLLLPLDEMETFFAENRIPDYKTSFTASYSKTENGYTFNNIAGIINYMAQKRRAGVADENWNKAVLIPVTLGTSGGSTISGSTGQVTKCSHDMSLTSTRLVGGADNPHTPIRISVIHSLFNGR